MTEWVVTADGLFTVAHVTELMTELLHEASLGQRPAWQRRKERKDSRLEFKKGGVGFLGRMAQSVRCLPCKHKDPPNPMKSQGWLQVHVLPALGR